MDNECWTEVLIQWVNCLKLCKTVRNLNELRNGDFFTSLQRLLTDKADKEPQDILTFVFNLLGKHYPSIIIENQKDIHLIDLRERDLKIIISLLMHYTCVHDRRDVLTSPLCYSLSQSTQVIIKNYLQKVCKKVTNQLLDKVIEQCVNEANADFKSQWTLTRTAEKSPLYQLLRTPISKVKKLQEKDQIIANLKSELEAERYDKADLQEELKKQHETIKTTEKQILQKNNEITRLRSEMSVLENGSTKSKKTDAQETQRCLKLEIESLEEYVRQVDKELDDVKQQRDVSQEKLKCLEKQCTIWQTRVFEVEKQFEEISYQSETQQYEIKNLQANCAELTALLDEYRAKSPNDSAIFENFMPQNNKSFLTNASVEDLACSCIEVQLKDAQKQNDELKKEIAALQECSKDFELKLTSTEEKLQESQKLINQLQSNNSEFSEKIQNLETQYQNAEQQLSATTTNLESNLMQVEELKTDRQTLKEELDAAKMYSAKCDEQLKNVSEEKHKIEKILSQCEETLANVESESKILTLEKQEALEKVECLEVETKERDLKIKSLEEHCQHVEKQLSEAIHDTESVKRQYEEQKLVAEEKLDQSQTLIDQLQENNSELSEKIHNLQTQYQNAEQQLSATTTNLETSLKQVEELKTDQQTLKEELYAATMYSEKCDEQLKNVSEEKQQIEKILSQCEETLAKVESESKILTLEKQEALEKVECLEVETKERDLKIKSLEEHCQHVEKQLSEAIHDTESVKRQYEEQKLVAEEKLDQSQTLIDQLQENNSGLSEKIHNLKTQYNNAEQQLSATTTNLESTLKQVDELKTDRQTLKEGLDAANMYSEKCDEQLKNVSKEKQQIEKILSQCEATLAKVESESTILTVEKQEALEKVQCLEIETKERDLKIKSLEEHCQHVEEQLSEAINDTESIKRQYEEYKLIAEEKLDQSQTLIGQLQENNSGLSKEIQDLETQYHNAEQQLSATTTNLESTLKQVEELKTDRQTLKEELDAANMYSEKCDEQLKNVSKEKQQIEKILSQCEATLAKVESESTILTVEKQEALEKVQCLEIETKERDLKIKLLEEHCQHVEKQLSETINDTESIKKQYEEQILVAEEKFDQSQTLVNQLQDNNSELSETIQNLETQYQIAEQHLSATTTHLESTLRQVEELNTDQEALKSELYETKMYSEKLDKELKNISEEKQQIEKILSQCQEALIIVQSESKILTLEKQEALEEAEFSEAETKERDLKIKSLEKHCRHVEKQLSKTIHDTESLKRQYEEQKLVAEKKLDQSQTLVNQLQDNNSELSQEIQNLETQYQNAEEQLFVTTTNLESTLTQIEELKSDREALQSELYEVKMYSEKRDKELKNITEEKQQIEKIVSQCKEALIMVQSESTILSLEKQEALEKVQSLELDIGERDSKLQTLDQQYQNIQEKLTKTDADLVNTTRQLQDLEIKYHLTQEELKATTQENSKLLAETRESAAKLESNNKILLSEKEEIFRNLQNLLEEKNRSELKIESLEQQYATILNELKVTKNCLQVAQDQCISHCQELELIKIKFTEITVLLQSTQNDLVNNNEEMTSKLEAKIKEISNLQQIERELEEMLGISQTQQEALNEELEKAKQEYSAISDQLEQRTVELEISNSKLSISDSMLESTITKLELATIVNDEIRRELEESKIITSNTIEGLAIKLTDCETEIVNNQQEKSELNLKIIDLESQYDNIKKQLLETSSILAETTKQCNYLKVDKDFLEKELVNMKLCVENCNQEIQDAKSENKDLNSIKQGIEDKVEQLESQNNEFSLKITIFESQLEKAEQLNISWKTNSEELLAENEKINKLLSLSEEKAILQKQEYDEKIIVLVEQSESLQNELDSTRDYLEKCTKQLEDTLIEKERINALVAEYKDTLGKVESEAQDKIQVLQGEITKFEIKVTALQTQNEHIQNELVESIAKLELSTKQAESLRDAHIELENNLKCLSEKSSEDVQQILIDNQRMQEKLEEQILELQSENSNLSSEKHISEEKLQILTHQIDESENKIKSLEKHCQQVEEQLSESKNNAESIQKQYNELKFVQDISLKEVDALKFRNEQIEKDLKETIAEKQKIESEHQTISEKKLQLLETQNSEIATQLQNEQVKIKILQEKLSEEKEQYKNNLVELQNEKKSLMLELEDSTQRILQIQEKATAKEIKFTTLSEKFGELQSMKEKYENNSEIKDSQERFESITLELNDLKERNEVLSKDKTGLLAKVAQLEKEKFIELETKMKKTKSPEKENILVSSNISNKGSPREEDLKKENLMLKKKIVLTENAKNNLEKVLKELRQEKKNTSTEINDIHYKTLLQQHIQTKEEYETIIQTSNTRYQTLLHQFEEFKSSTPIKLEEQKKLNEDLHNIREAYGNVMSTNSKLELENVTLRKIIEERTTDLAVLSQIKEAYEKLLEENNKLMTEVDTIKYKRTRDKEEYVRLLKKEREEGQNRESKKVHYVRSEYEGKLERMKDKMLKLYRDEVNKVQKVKEGQNENGSLQRSVTNLKSELFEASQRIHMLEMERDMLKLNSQTDMYSSRESLRYDPSFRDRHSVVSRSARDSLAQTQDLGSVLNAAKESRRATTLPRQTSLASMAGNIGSTLQMEDEEDLFNDKYLTDMKEGRCALPATGQGANARFSELAWRNSFVPPHLKSSYPAETQFATPSRFKEEDMKSGNVPFEDSLCKLLPGEKPKKKDFGTTSYKRPGPPTPSKNGGRLSLQSNEIHPLKEPVDAKTPKRSTPNRLKALFSTGRNSISNSEIQTTTPNRTKRLNIFRKPR